MRIVLIFTTLASLALLVYIYLGYPLLIWLLARLHAHPVRKSDVTPTVSLLIPAHNEEAVIAEKLENALALDYPPEKLRIIVGDDGSQDRTAAIVEPFTGNRVILSHDPVRRGKVGVLNRLIGLVDTEIAVISDADILLDAGAIRAIAANFADERVGGVVGRATMLSGESSTASSGGIYWKYEAIIRDSESLVHSMVGASGALMAVRSNLLSPIPEGTILDDFYVAMIPLMRGYRVVFEPVALCMERPTQSMEDETNRRRRISAGRYQLFFSLLRQRLFRLPSLLVFEIVSHKFLRLIIPQLMILLYLSNLLLVVWQPARQIWLQTFFIILLIVQTVFYLAALGGMLTERTRFRSKVLNLPYYLCTTNFASLLGLLWYLSGNRTVLWQQARRQQAASSQESS